MPRERDLVEKYRGRPFAFLGVDREESREAGLKVVAAQQVTRPNWHDGGAGPIAARYHVKGFPTSFVIDAEGTIRHKNAIGDGIDKAVDQILVEMEAAPAR